MLLNKLFKNAPEIEIEQLSTDSRIKMHNAIFFCLSGIMYDGHSYIDEAIDNGAKVVVYSDDIEKNKKAIYIRVKDVSEVLTKIANIYYNYPAKDLDIYMIIGNYGRCSIGKMINHCLNKEEICAYIGILGIQYLDINKPMDYPTLSNLDNIQNLNLLRSRGCNSLSIEATASALNLRKLEGSKPDVFIFTGCNERSSEYGSSNHEYYNWVRRYLYTLEETTKVIINNDDKSVDELKDSFDSYVSCGVKEGSDYQIQNVLLSFNGLSYDLLHDNNSYHVECKLQGMANVYNLTFTIAALCEKGHDINKIIEYIKDIDYIPGIYEKADEEYNVLIDSAYDICSIEEIGKYAKQITKGKVISLIGLNYSDSDARISKVINALEKFSDVIYLTEDESDESEIMAILNRADEFSKKNNIVKCSYRSIAIDAGISIMNKDDTFLILGKGNEKFLIMGLGKERYPGDLLMAKKHIKERRDLDNEIEQIY